jgi:hypothetical protein
MSKAWIAAPFHEENIDGEYQIVFDRIRASEMSNGNGQQLMRAVEKASSALPAKSLLPPCFP